MRNQTRALQPGFAHADDAAAADFDAGTAHAAERVEPMLIIACRNHVTVKLGRGIEIVVVVIEAGVFQFFCLALAQHAERGAGFQTECFDFTDHFFNLFEVAIFRFAPCCAHAKARCAVRFGFTCGSQYRIERQDFLCGDASVVACGLRAIAAVFRAATGLDRQQRGEFDFGRIEMFAMNLLRTK